jgi:hypothetical protein
MVSWQDITTKKPRDGAAANQLGSSKQSDCFRKDKAEDAARRNFLPVTAIVERQPLAALELLGIEAPEKM